MAAKKWTEEELALLTDDEREGMLEDDEGGDDDGGEGAAEDDGTAAAADDEDGDDDGEGNQAAEGDAAAAVADAAVVPDLEPDAAEEEDEPLEDDEVPGWILHQNIAEKAAALKAQRAEIAKQFDDGELLGNEFLQKMEALADEQRAIDTQQISADIEKKHALKSWGGAVKAFTTAHPEYGPDSPLRGLLDVEVRKLQASVNNPTNPALLERAHKAIQKTVAAAYGVKPAEPAAKPTDKKAAATALKKRPAPPPTLASVPASDISEADDGGEFAYLDRLAEKDSVGFERELAKLEKSNPAAHERYLQQG
jgi:hypothetical protein